jgi:hypothetical protein
MTVAVTSDRSNSCATGILRIKPRSGAGFFRHSGR